MNKILFFAFAVLFVCTSFANTIVDGVVKLPKNFKVENTFSGDLQGDTSFHLIFSKNKDTKQYTIHQYIFDGKNVEELPQIESENEFELVSFHQQNDVLHLLFSYEKKKDDFLQPISVDLKTKKITKGTALSNEDFSTSFRTKNRSVLIYKTDNELIIKDFDANNNPIQSVYSFNGKKDAVKKFLKDKSIVPIRTDEFVKNGATSTLKGYLSDSGLILSKDEKDENLTQILTLNFSEKNIKASEIKSYENKNGEKDFKKFASYVNNEKLYQLGLNKKGGKIKISEIKSDQTENTIDLNASLASKIKGNKEFQGMEEFLKNAGKNKYNATITVNPTKDKKLRVRVDYVDKSYSYQYNWWWHHQQFMMWHHHNMMHNVQFSAPTGFGPRQPNDFVFESATLEKEKRYFELLIDTNGELSDEDLPDTIHKEIDKKEYVDKLDDTKGIKHPSSCFVGGNFRYIAYSKKSKSFIFQTEEIK